MQTNADTIFLLKDHLPASEVSQVIPALLRVPESFAYLQEQLQGDAAGPFDSAEDFLPVNLAARLLVDEASQEGREVMTGEEPLALPCDATFVDLAHASLKLATQLNNGNPEGMQELAAQAGSSQVRSLLALAFNRIESPEIFMEDAFTSSNRQLQEAWINALLANFSPEQTACWVEDHLPSRASELVYKLRGQKGEALENDVDGSPRVSSNDPFSESQRLMAYGKHDVAREMLQSAWQNLSQQIASIADRLGQVSELEKDPLTAVEARRQALEIHPTALRRARWIVSLLEQGQLVEANAQIQGQPTNLEEQIAFGLVALENGDLAEAQNQLTAAFMQLNVTSTSPRWLQFLAEGLQAAGAISEAIEVIKRLVALFPADPKLRTTYATLLADAGDASAASREALIASMLTPDSAQPRIVLATSLQASGDPSRALSIWEELAAEDPCWNEQMARCALEGGQLEPARKAVSGLLTGDPDQKLLGHIFMGRIALAQKDHQQARLHFNRALEKAPDQTEAWVALAESQEAIGDIQAAEKTLAGAIQRYPSESDLFAALGKHFHRQGRLTDALKALDEATRLDSGNADLLLERGTLLLALGQWEQARNILQRVMQSKPLAWEAQHALACAQEQAGELSAAIAIVHRLPDHASEQAFLDAGRILSKSIQPQEDRAMFDQARSMLDKAERRGAEMFATQYWKAFAAESNGSWEQALNEYRTCFSAANVDRDVKLDAILGFARCALKLDRASLAVKVLREQQAQYPASTSLLSALSENYLHAGETAHALSVANQALEMAPRKKDLLRLVGKCAQSNGNDDMAMAALKRLTDIDMRDAAAWRDYARLAFETGDTDTGRNAIARSIYCNRKDIDNLIAAAQVLHPAGLLRSALRILRHSANHLVPNIDQQRSIGLLAETLEDTELAHRTWQHVIEEEPENVDAIDRCASALWSLHRRSAAIGLWQRALSINPENAHFHQMLGRAMAVNGEGETSLLHYAKSLECSPDDGELALEAGLASMKHGQYEEALERLNTASLLRPDDVDARMGLAQCKLALGHIDDAHDALLQISLEGTAPSRAFAMLAIASVEQGDLASAEAAIEQAFSQPFHDEGDSIWGYRAAFRLMQWERGIEALEMGMRRDQTLEMLATLTSAYLQLSMAQWLIDSICHAGVHAPDMPASSQAFQDQIDRLIERMRRMEAPTLLLNSFTYWTDLLFDRETASSAQRSESSQYSAEIQLAEAIHDIRKGAPLNATVIKPHASLTGLMNSLQKLVVGYAHAATGNNQQARAQYQLAAEDIVVSALSEYLTASLNVVNGSVDEAIGCMNAALAKWPEEHRWHYELAALYLDVSQPDAALPHLQEAVETSPENGDYLHTLARSLFSTGDLSRAAAYYERVLSLKPEAPVVWKEAGAAALAIGSAEKAAQWFERACTLLPSDSDCLVGTARALLLQGNLDHALERTESALRLAPSNPNALMTIGDIYSQLGRLDEALQTYDRVLHRADNPVPVHIARARLYIKGKRLEEAFEEMQTALRSYPESEEAWLALAEMYEGQGQLDQACDAATRLVNLAPHHADYRLTLGRICRKQGHLDRAMNELLIAEKSAPLNIELVLELGSVFEERRELPQALRCYERATSIAPHQSESFFRSGLLFKQMKQYAQAVTQFKKAAELDPHNPNIHHQLAAVHALQLVHGLTPEMMVTQ